jgi:hypothetical protein
MTRAVYVDETRVVTPGEGSRRLSLYATRERRGGGDGGETASRTTPFAC